MSEHSSEKDAAGVLTPADIVRLGKAVLTDDTGVAVGFDHSVVQHLVAQALKDAADDVERECASRPGSCFCGSGDWLRVRAARVTPPTEATP